MIELLIFAMLSGVIGGFISSQLIIRHLTSEAEDLEEHIISKMREDVIPCRLEFVNNTIFMYNRDTDDFIAQGKTFEELEQRCKERFPDKYFDVKQEDIEHAKNLGQQNG